MSSPLNVLVVGGSRNSGYYSSVRLLKKGYTVTFLLRNASVFDADEDIQPHVRSGKARLVQGDALKIDDVKNAWNEASKDAPVDLLLFSVGFTGKPGFHILKGFVIDPPNLVTQSLLNCLSTIPKVSPSPKIIIISTSAATKSSRGKAPFLLKPVYGYLISGPAADKLGVEKVVHILSGWEWNSKANGEPSEEVLPKDWTKIEGLPAPGSLNAIAVVHAAMLTDGECLADTAAAQGQKLPYRTGPAPVAGYTVSRRDVAHFVVEGVLAKWEEYGNKELGIAY
ncbi:hypothetical protein FA15DRAFT_620769 [Coprinopsis marcescibilis]|uniref:NAD(P)-binding domain-containing protein n=1 Tax=Coprinopsis marcescibilis TaxID=230819 RepID=A0A5C3L5G7_COPMA|nr:hypothetical protein FA15DRAFT_620769 [Coprinopsis marcescibilis]